FQGSHVRGRFRVAVLALHAGLQILEMHGGTADRAGRVAAKTIRHLVMNHFPAGRLRKILRLGGTRAHSEIETVDGLVKAHAALIERSIALEYIGLARFAEAESPADRDGQRGGAVRDAVNALAALACDGVGIAPVLESEPRVVAQDIAVFPTFQRVAHGGRRLSPRLPLMTTGANGR